MNSDTKDTPTEQYLLPTLTEIIHRIYVYRYGMRRTYTHK